MGRRTSIYVVLLSVQLLYLSSAQAKPNVLFIISDDMRSEINALMDDDFPTPTHPKMHTPNLDRLADRSIVMKHMYTSLAQCTASRTSLLTSRRPDTTHVYDLVSQFRKTGGDFTTLPQYFKENGYRTAGMGKILNMGSITENDPISWTQPYYFPSNYDYWSNFTTTWSAVAEEEYLNKPLPDQQILVKAKSTLRELASEAQSQPFFLAVGFLKPHVPFNTPAKYFAHYPLSSIELPANPYVPENIPPTAWYNSGEITHFDDLRALNVSGDFNSTFPDFVTLNLRRAYYSSVTFIDDMVGRLIQEVDDLGLSNNTIISFAGDHGFHLGEHAEWGKITNFELNTQLPFMLHIPGMTDRRRDIHEITEFVDVFPTLAEAAGLPGLPACPDNSTDVKVCREGISFLPLFAKSQPWKKYAFSQITRSGNIMGYTLRGDRYRYTEWAAFNYTSYTPIWEINHGIELYDRKYDPQETINVVNDCEYSDVIGQLKIDLRAGWRAVQPKEDLMNAGRKKKRYMKFGHIFG